MTWRIPNTGQNIEIGTEGTNLRYRYVGTSDWINITSLASLSAPGFGLTTSATQIPNVDSTVVVDVNSTAFVVKRAVVLISDGTESFNGEVTAINQGTSTITVKNLGIDGDSNPGTNIATNATIVVGGSGGGLDSEDQAKLDKINVLSDGTAGGLTLAICHLDQDPVAEDRTIVTTSDLKTDQIFQSTTTGWEQGGSLSLNTDPTKFNIDPDESPITETHGHVVANTLVPYQVEHFKTAIANVTGLSVSALATRDVTYVGVTTPQYLSQVPLGSTTTAITTFTPYTPTVYLVESPRNFTIEERNFIIPSGTLIHRSRTQIDDIIQGVQVLSSPALQTYALGDALGIINSKGNEFSFGTGLTLSKNSGELHSTGINVDGTDKNKKQPNDKVFPAQNPVTFRYFYRDGAGGWNESADTTALVPGSWDDGTGTLNVVNGSNYSIQNVFLLKSGKVNVLYGQAEYSNLEDAKIAFSTYRPDRPDDFNDLAILRASIILRGNGDTALSEIVGGEKITGDNKTSSGKGNDGKSSYTITTSQFSIPSVGATIAVSTSEAAQYSNQAFTPGLTVGVGVYRFELVSVDSTNQITIRNNVETPGTIVNNGSSIVALSPVEITSIRLPLFISTPIVENIELNLPVQGTGTVASVIHKVSGGSLNFSAKINATNITGLTSINSTTSQTTNSSTAANTITSTDNLTLSINSVSSAVNFSITIVITGIT